VSASQRGGIVAQLQSQQSLVDRCVVFGQFQQHLCQRLRILTRQKADDLFLRTDAIHRRILLAR